VAVVRQNSWEHAGARRTSLNWAGDYRLISFTGDLIHGDAIETPPLWEENNAEAAVESVAGGVDIGAFDFEFHAVFEAIVDVAAIAGEPQGKKVTGRHEIEGVDFEINVTVAGRNLGNVKSMMPSAGFGDKRTELGVEAETETWTKDGFLSVIEKAEDDGVAAACDCLRLAIARKKLTSGVTDFATASARLDLRQVRSLLGVRESAHVGFDDVASGTILADTATVDPDAARTEIFDSRHVVGDEENGATAIAHVFHGVETFFFGSRRRRRRGLHRR